MTTFDRALVFDIWGDYAHFRRGYTTTSPLTYPFPTRTALSGMMAAVLGLPRDSYYEAFEKENSAFAVQILNPIKKIRIKENLIDTKTGFYLQDNRGQRTQIEIEFIKKPKFRIYMWNKKYLEDISSLLSEHKTKYTLYLGVAYCIANFEYKGIYPVEKNLTHGEEVEISTVIKNKDNLEIKMEEGKKYGKIKIPGFMNKDRVVEEFIEVIYEATGKSINITNGEYYAVRGIDGETNVSFF